MENGISVYPGLDNTLEENLALIELAASCGIKRLFTSLHIPETDADTLRKEVGPVLQAAKAHHMEVISDVTPGAMELLGIQESNISAFRMRGITTLRLDDGYSPEEIAKLSRNKQGTRIQLNASTMTGKLLTALINAKTNFGNIDALHNFYPRPGTGLSEEAIVRKTVMLHKAGIGVGAFVPSQRKKRSPLFDGLPTLEDHRQMEPGLAARHLIALGIDSVFIGDCLPDERELRAIASLRADQISIRAKMLTKDPVQQELLGNTFTSRVDEARDAIRAQESRGLVSGPIYPENTIERRPGDITIDNEGYLRYMGELEIIKTPQPADRRTNVAARILEDEVFLLDYITPGRKFSFLFEE
ncbi:MAG: DUF871 domain-containing protein [Selenomonadaceae bacterium]|nr:DUF871 domain-containing protein [Selenomonadaceae bacterium]